MKRLLFVDLANIVHPTWFAMARGGATPSAVSGTVVRKLREMEPDYDAVAICCDVPGARSFRDELYPAYKEGRKEKAPALRETYALTIDGCRAHFPVFGVVGFEADDVIATLVAWARREFAERALVVMSNDKDVLGLVAPDLVVIPPFGRGRTVNAAGVFERLGVSPGQVRDYLALCGDGTDGVKGVPGIGAMKARQILARWGSLEAAVNAVYTESAKALDIAPSLWRALRDGAMAADLAVELVTLRTDVPIDFSQFAECGVPL